MEDNIDLAAALGELEVKYTATLDELYILCKEFAISKGFGVEYKTVRNAMDDILEKTAMGVKTMKNIEKCECGSTNFKLLLLENLIGDTALCCDCGTVYKDGVRQYKFLMRESFEKESVTFTEEQLKVVCETVAKCVNDSNKRIIELTEVIKRSIEKDEQK